MVLSRRSSDSSNLSDPTSPPRISLSNGVSSNNVPPSPKGEKASFPFDLGSESGVLSFGSKINSDIDDFEFNTTPDFKSPPWDHKQQQQQLGQLELSFSSISFADEQNQQLCCDGQVLPLRSPPRLQCANNKNCNNQSLSSSPRSPSSVLMAPFSCWSFRQDPDPFMVALEHAREEQRDLENSHRRSRSLSPLRTTSKWPNDSTGAIQQKTNQKNPVKTIQGIGSIPSHSTNCKKLVSASPDGAKRSAHQKAIKPTLTKSATKSEGCWGSGKQKTKYFPFRSASEGRADIKDKLRSKTGALMKSPFLGKISFKSVFAAYYNEKKRESHEMKKTIIPYKPRMFVCLGFGPRDLH